MESSFTINIVLLWGIALLNLVIALALVRRLSELLELARKSQPKSILAVGEKIPYVEVVDTNAKVVTNHQWLGKKTALVFVSTSCQPCRQAMPEIEELYWNAQKNNVHFVVVVLADLNDTRHFADEIGFNAPIYAVNETNSFAEALHIVSTPSFYMLDQQGRITSGGRLGREWRDLTSQWKSSPNTMATQLA